MRGKLFIFFICFPSENVILKFAYTFFLSAKTRKRKAKNTFIIKIKRKL